MDDPVADVTDVILRLTKGSPRTQQQAIEQYFVPKASFFHPFCSVHHNRNAILRIFQWYKIMSPHIDISINSIAYDEKNLTLYVNISQIFRIFIIPFYTAPVTLTTVLQLERGQDIHHHPQLTSEKPHLGKAKYYIRSQNDLYQIDQFIRFVLPWGIGTTIILLWHWVATLCCIVGARVAAPLRWNNQAVADARPRYPDVPLEEDPAEEEIVLLNGERSGWAETLRNVSANERALIDLQQRHRG